MLCIEAENINFTVFKLTLLGIKSMICHTCGQQPNQYIIEMVWL